MRSVDAFSPDFDIARGDAGEGGDRPVPECSPDMANKGDESMVLLHLGLFGWLKPRGRQSVKRAASPAQTTSAAGTREETFGIFLYQQNDILQQRIPSLDLRLFEV